MNNRAAESGIEFVLDNRKIILTFALLITICGCFFIVGFVEGKRQGIQEGTQASVEALSKTSPNEEQKRETKSADVDSAGKQLDWYKNINRPEGRDTTEPRATSPAPARPAAQSALPPAKPAAKPNHEASAVRPTPASYSVQVGAFRQRHEADAKAQVLQSKGYDCRVEPPIPPGQLFLIKVGKFKTRAEAIAMQLRLKKDGFTAFIKTN